MCLVLNLFCLTDSRSRIFFVFSSHMEPYVYKPDSIVFFQQMYLPPTGLLIKNE